MHKNGSIVKCISEPIIGPLGFLSRIQGIYLIAILMVAPRGIASQTHMLRPLVHIAVIDLTATRCTWVSVREMVALDERLQVRSLLRLALHARTSHIIDAPSILYIVIR